MRILATRKGQGHRVECIDNGVRRPLTVDELIEFRAAQAKAEIMRMVSTRKLLFRQLLIRQLTERGEAVSAAISPGLRPSR